MRGIECHVIHKAEAMDHTRSTVVSLIGGHTPGLLGRLYLREQIRMIAVFHTENIVQPVDMQCLDVGCIEPRLSSVTMNLRWGWS